MSMANSFPDSAPLILLALLLAGPAGAAEFEFNRELPINLNSDSSEFDRLANRLLFMGLRITQGPLSIEADQGKAEKLDFENSRWEFTGNVVIHREPERVWSDDATLFFRDHQLTNARLSGEPVRFQQTGEDDSLTKGEARRMEYDPIDGIVRMMGSAWISDGSNEVRGERITYDLIKEQITAEGDESGGVRMKITPPDQEESEPASPAPEPSP